MIENYPILIRVQKYGKEGFEPTKKSEHRCSSEIGNCEYGCCVSRSGNSCCGGFLVVKELPIDNNGNIALYAMCNGC